MKKKEIALHKSPIYQNFYILPTFNNRKKSLKKNRNSCVMCAIKYLMG